MKGEREKRDGDVKEALSVTAKNDEAVFFLYFSFVFSVLFSSFSRHPRVFDVIEKSKILEKDAERSPGLCVVTK